MSNFVEKKSIFEGMTMSQMKDAYSKMTAKERGQFAGAFVRAAKTAKKPAAKKTTKATSSTQQAKKPAPKKPTKSKSKVFKSMYKPGKMVGKDVKGRASMPYAGKFPGEPDKKEEKKKKPRNLGKGSFRNLYK
jgi:hypothetical protein